VDAVAFQQLLKRLIALPLLVLIPFSGILAFSVWRLETSASWVDHTDQVLTASSRMLRNMIDQETGVRGYITVRDRSYLEPYEKASRTFPELYQNLSRLVSDNPGQQKKLEGIKTQYDHWLALTRGALEDTDLTQPEVLTYSAEGRREMDSIRKDVATFVIEEENLRDVRNRETTDALHRVYWGTGILTILASLLIGGSIYRSIRKLNVAYSSQLAAVFEERQWLETTLRGIGDAVIACDAQGRIVFMNQPAETCTGWSERDAKGLPLATPFHIVNEETRNIVESPVDKVIRIGSVVGLANHTILIRKDGSEINIDDSGAPIRNSHGELVGVVLVFRDITEARHTEKALIRSEKLATAGRLAATIAHEVNNPLESATNLVYLAQCAEISEQARHYLTAADAELRRVSHLTRQSLAFYREQAMAQKFRPVRTIAEIVELYRVRVASREIAVKTEVDESLLMEGYEGEVRQVLANIIGNSYDAIRTAGSIRIRARQVGNNGSGPMVQFTIADTGSGIPPENLARIFEPFFTTKVDVGTGLGLWVTKTIVEKRGGRIRVRSCANGTSSYTVISFAIPLKSTHASLSSSA
jgi:PAS domain S-box-containing protein